MVGRDPHHDRAGTSMTGHSASVPVCNPRPSLPARRAASALPIETFCRFTRFFNGKRLQSMLA